MSEEPGVIQLKSTIKKMYERLAEFIFKDIELFENMTILEGGCGRGQLTIPFLYVLEEKIQNYEYFALDVSSGPYENTLNSLKERIHQTEFQGKIELIEGDVTSLNSFKEESISLIVSNELFCDLNREKLKKALKEFYRVLEPKGQMCHSELIAYPVNYAQELFIKADSYSIETVTPEYEWFSPCADELIALMRRTGFNELKIHYFETNVHLDFDDAIETIKDWNIDEDFFKKYENELKENGIEYPLEHVIYCKKL